MGLLSAAVVALAACCVALLCVENGDFGHVLVKPESLSHCAAMEARHCQSFHAETIRAAGGFGILSSLLLLLGHQQWATGYPSPAAMMAEFGPDASLWPTAHFGRPVAPLVVGAGALGFASLFWAAYFPAGCVADTGYGRAYLTAAQTADFTFASQLALFAIDAGSIWTVHSGSPWYPLLSIGPLHCVFGLFVHGGLRELAYDRSTASPALGHYRGVLAARLLPCAIIAVALAVAVGHFRATVDSHPRKRARRQIVVVVGVAALWRFASAILRWYLTGPPSSAYPDYPFQAGVVPFMIAALIDACLPLVIVQAHRQAW